MKPAVDWAKSASFTVTDRRPTRWPDREDFHVRAFDRHGNLAYHTWHRGESSMMMEVEAWLSRGARPQGECAAKVAEQIQAFATKRAERATSAPCG